MITVVLLTIGLLLLLLAQSVKPQERHDARRKYGHEEKQANDADVLKDGFYRSHTLLIKPAIMATSIV